MDNREPTGRRLSWVFKLGIIVGAICCLFAYTNKNDTNSISLTTGTASDGLFPLKKNRPLAPQETLDLTFRPEMPTDEKNRTQIGGEKATIFMLVRNEELYGALQTMRHIEDRFNHRFRYPWTFLNDKEFTDEFKELATGMASGKIEFGYINPVNWSVPQHIDQSKMRTNMAQMDEANVVYGGSLSYRHMCRFNSGLFHDHYLMTKYDYYWRVEPEVQYFCDQLYDPFEFMRLNDKMYGFVIAILEYPDTIPTLWNTTQEFIDKYPEHLAVNNAMDFILDNNLVRNGDLDLVKDFDYNLCHFWSNFEIANLNFFRSKEYQAYFKYLDQAGGFYYERWGDAPVHTIGASLLLNKTQIHHFNDIGYLHEPYFRCPKDDASYLSGRCLCPEAQGLDVDFETFSCLPKWWIHVGKEFVFRQKKPGDI